MKRRNFILCTALSVSAVNSAFASINTDSSPSIENNLKKYLAAVGAQGELKYFHNEQLTGLCDSRSKSFSQTGYKSYGSKLYFCSDHKVAIFPLILTTEATGILDISLLFFRKVNDGSWVYSNTFSNFHLESIVNALPELTPVYSTDKLADLLCPISTAPSAILPHTIFTKGGSLTTIVKIEEQKTHVDFTIKARGNEIFAKSGLSGQSLSCNSLA